MRIIYEPRGRALEYAPLAASGYRNCNHGCRYCFNPLALHCTAEDFSKPVVRQRVLTAFEKDCKELAAAKDQREILLSFSTDPYNELEDRYHITREMISILIRYGLHFTILTKGLRGMRDWELLCQRPDLCRFGTTLTLIDIKDQELWEPHAARTEQRIADLVWAHKKGIRTWVSLEPVIKPEDTLILIDYTHSFVDEFRIGKFNHTRTLEPFMDSIGYIPLNDRGWVMFVQDAKALLDRHGCKYIFKKDLQPYLQYLTDCEIPESFSQHNGGKTLP